MPFQLPLEAQRACAQSHPDAQADGKTTEKGAGQELQAARELGPLQATVRREPQEAPR